MPICQINFIMLPCVCSVTDQIADGFKMWQQKKEAQKIMAYFKYKMLFASRDYGKQFK